jgi:hypothetical protein
MAQVLLSTLPLIVMVPSEAKAWPPAKKAAAQAQTLKAARH